MSTRLPDVTARRAMHEALVASGRLEIPTSLPIAAAVPALRAAIGDRQVVIVAGETGSGKSTQLPKLCLALGRGIDGIVGHTQPRRVAARSIAERIAQELETSVGDLVGYSVRFDDRVGDRTLVRVMTDGILLAEIQRDRLLRRYDTIIVDEAHERSLNIDFILGYLKRLLAQRPELKVIVTSATIDTERFARHFADEHGHAPVVEVSGRTFPVEVRYRPFGSADGAEPGDDRDQVQAICDAVDELTREIAGDVLVFLSGEREIHDTADALRRRSLPETEVLPLYARLSAAEQHRVFAPHTGRRIVLSTNVAETSLTVPGIRAVVDAGTARISRYSRRLKVQRLPIEPVSKASADQRAGRCGRVAPGICVRLYSEADHLARPDQTEPEILRTNLASVILQMTALGLGDVAAFPYLEPPDAASVRDGYQLLVELGAIEPPSVAEVPQLTPIGRRLARLPVDPRIGRMVLEADRFDCVREVLVIAAALSIQDPRERPADQRERADELHRRFAVDGSDLLSIVALWDHLRVEQRRLSGNQFRRLCRSEFLNYLRIREWQDLFSQLRHVAGQLGIRGGARAARPDHVHRAVLAGLLSHVGMRDRDGREYLGARASRFVIAPGSVLSRRRPRWVMAAELVETHRIHARRVATIQPEWVEQAAAHLVARSYGEPRWDEQRGAAVADESVTLYGLPIVAGRIVGYDRVDPVVARALFVRHALVGGEWHRQHGFVARNDAFLERVGELEARVRRTDLVDEEALAAFYDERVPAEVTSTRRFDRWWHGAMSTEPHRLDLSDELLGGLAGVRPDDYPDEWSDGDLRLPLTYRFEPGSPLDGVTVEVPVVLLNQVCGDGLDWHVPGHRAELVEALVRTLPKQLRRQLIPMADTARAAFHELGAPNGRFVDALARALRAVSGVTVHGDDFDPSLLPPHLRIHVVVLDRAGRVIDAGDDPVAIARRQASTMRAEIAAAVPITERRGLVDWEVGTIARRVEGTDDRPGGGESAMAGSAHVVVGFPALFDEGASVAVRVLTNEHLQQRVMRAGVRRLLLLTVPPAIRSMGRARDQSFRGAATQLGLSVAELLDDCRSAVVDRVMADAGELPWDRGAFEALQDLVRARGQGLTADTVSAVADIVVDAARVRGRLEAPVAAVLHDSYLDAAAHLDRLVRAGFVTDAGLSRLPDLRRYVRGVEFRLDRLAGEVARDQRRMREVQPLEVRYASLVDGLGRPLRHDEIDVGWQLEELRVAVFAQPLGVHGQVSATRIRRALDALGG